MLSHNKINRKPNEHALAVYYDTCCYTISRKTYTENRF